MTKNRLKLIAIVGGLVINQAAWAYVVADHYLAAKDMQQRLVTLGQLATMLAEHVDHTRPGFEEITKLADDINFNDIVKGM